MSLDPGKIAAILAQVDTVSPEKLRALIGDLVVANSALIDEVRAWRAASSNGSGEPLADPEALERHLEKLVARPTAARLASVQRRADILPRARDALLEQKALLEQHDITPTPAFTALIAEIATLLRPAGDVPVDPAAES